MQEVKKIRKNICEKNLTVLIMTLESIILPHYWLIHNEELYNSVR